MRTFRKMADKLADRVAPEVTGEAVWWYKYRCYNGKIQRNQCWDSSFCNGWQYTGESCN